MGWFTGKDKEVNEEVAVGRGLAYRMAMTCGAILPLAPTSMKAVVIKWEKKDLKFMASDGKRLVVFKPPVATAFKSTGRILLREGYLSKLVHC